MAPNTWHQKNTASIASNGIGAKTVRVDLHASPPPDNGVCIDWYWTVYDRETMQILSERYVGSTGNCGGPVDSTPDNNDELTQCAAQYEEELANFEEIAAGSAASPDGESEIDPGAGPDTAYEKPWNRDWPALTNIFPFALMSNETGTLKLTGNTDDFVWAFKDIKHAGVTPTGFIPPYMIMNITEAAHFSQSAAGMAAVFVYAVGIELTLDIVYKFNPTCVISRRGAIRMVAGHYTPHHFFRVKR
jgi:hypothetical protein